MTDVPTLLSELEKRWSRRGCPVTELLRPGIAEDVVRRALGRLLGERDVPAEIIEWFGWHDGPIGSGEPARLAPSDFLPLSLEAALWAWEYLRCVAKSIVDGLAGDPPGSPTDPDYFWSKDWLPIGWNEYWLSADLSGPGTATPVRVVGSYESEDFRVVKVESLASMVRGWLDAPDQAWWWSGETRRWERDLRLIPVELRSNVIL